MTVDIDETLFLERDEDTSLLLSFVVYAESKNDLQKKLQDLQSSLQKS